MKRTGWVIVAIVAGASAALVVSAWVVAANAPARQTVFPPWYPATNDAGDSAFVDFENHVPCAIDDPPGEGPTREFGLVLYRDSASNGPTTYVMSRVRWG